MELVTASLTHVTLAVLAGGAGSRMGRPKGLLQIGGRPILQYLLDRFDWPGPTCLVTAPGREHPPGWESFDREISDPVEGLGPLRGILTGLEQLNTPLLIVTTVDMPGMQRKNLEWLVSEAALSDDVGLMCSRMVGSRSIIEPFPMILRKEALASIKYRVETNRLSVHDLANDARFITRAAPANWSLKVWTNLNRPTDLEGFERSLPP